MGKCDICGSLGETKHLPIYANGSEGIVVCTPCLLTITEFVRHLCRLGVRAKIAKVRNAKGE